MTKADHGTRSRYTMGCKCAACSDANAVYMRAARAKRDTNLVSFNDLAVNCWCEATIVHVPPAELKAGRTRSCGLRHCANPTVKAS